MRTVLFALLLASTTAAVASAPGGQRDLQNEDVIMSLYPKRALAAGEQGVVYFNVMLDRDGHPTECEVTKSSGFRRLDEETCTIIVQHAKFKPVQDETGSRTASKHEGAINWRLPSGSIATAPATQVAQASAPEKMICRRVEKTGSLVARERVCMTKREWQRATDDSKGSWEELQGSKGFTAGQ